MRVGFTIDARRDLSSIFDYIAADSLRQAIAMVGRLEAAALELGDGPLRHPLIPFREQAGVRRRTVRPYIIFYRVHDDRVEVVHVLHGARNYDAILFGDDET